MAITRGSQLLLEREDVRDISKCIFEAMASVFENSWGHPRNETVCHSC